MRFAKLGQTKPSGPTGLGFPRRKDLRKETRERKSYAIDRPFRSDFESIGLPLLIILFEAGQIENEMQKEGKGSKPFFGLRAARPTEVPRLTLPYLTT